MPTTREHLVKARRAEALSAAIEITYPEWAVTALFYAAVHYVEAYFYMRNATNSGIRAHCDTHAERARAVRDRIGSHYRNYRALEERSMEARYYVVDFRPEEVHDLRRHRLEPLKQWITSQLNPKP